MDTIFENILAILIAGIWIFSAIRSRNRANREQRSSEEAPTPAAKPLLRPYHPTQRPDMVHPAEQPSDQDRHVKHDAAKGYTGKPAADHTGPKANGESGYISRKPTRKSNGTVPSDAKYDTVSQTQQPSDEMAEGFDLRKAVIYSEILNPKFKEEE